MLFRSRTLDQLGIHFDGIGTTAIAGGLDITRPLPEDLKALVARSVQRTYADFIGKVAMHREQSVEEIDASAQGRVWVGTDALERGLVDRLGTLAAAVESTAELAGLEPDSYALDYLELEPTFAERLLLSMTAKTVAGVNRVVDLPKWPAVVTEAVESTLAPLAFVEKLNDPRGVYAYCFCDTR